jgi:hypothetical protein
MNGAIRGMTQRGDANVEAALLESPDLLRDEGLGQPGIALEDEQDGVRHGIR